MSYSVDVHLLRQVGQLLAAGTGTFTAADVRRMFKAALADEQLIPSELAAMLVVCAMVGGRCDHESAALLTKAVEATRKDDPGVERWLGSSVSVAVLRRVAALIAGRGPGYRVSRDEIVELVRYAYHEGGAQPGVDASETLALQIAREVLHGRITPEAEKVLDDLFPRPGGHRPGAGGGRQGGSQAAPPSGGQQCGSCSGSGSVTCGACGGYGYHQRSGTRTRWDGETEYYDESIPCGCNGGYRTCGACGGSGRR